MAPKLPKGAVPTGVAALKALLGPNPTPEDIKNLGKETAGLRNKAMVQFKQQLETERLAEYNALKSDMERRQWLCEYMIDPETAKCQATNTTERATTDDTTEAEVWVTETEYAGPKWLNDKAQAAIAITAMTSRPHKRNAALRAAGVLEYLVIVDEKKSTTTLRQSAATSATADMSAEQYVSVTDHMRNAGKANEEPDGKRRRKGGRDNADPPKPPKPPVPEDPTKVEHAAAAETFDKSMRAAKVMVDKIRKELNEVGLVERRLASKSLTWGPGPLEFLKGKTQEVSGKVEIVFARWIDAKDYQLTLASKDAVDIKAYAKDLDAIVENTQAEYKFYAKNVVGEFAKQR